MQFTSLKTAYFLNWDTSTQYEPFSARIPQIFQIISNEVYLDVSWVHSNNCMWIEHCIAYILHLSTSLPSWYLTRMQGYKANKCLQRLSYFAMLPGANVFQLKTEITDCGDSFKCPIYQYNVRSSCSSCDL